jgi:hypothetical protein
VRLITGWLRRINVFKWTIQAQKEMHLFQEIKKTKDQVEQLYHEMNIQPKAQGNEMPDSDQQLLCR